MTIPIAISPGRSSFGPSLALSYDSGAGNGPFGLGWSLSLPSIVRKTDKGLPIYVDLEDSDVFILSGAEDLVPVLADDVTGQRDRSQRTVHGVRYEIRRYRPRVEGLFARIERWTNTADPADVFWRSITKDNVTTWYGRTPESRIADPQDRSRVFSWLICETHDDKGNVIVFGYQKETTDNVDVHAACERNRSDAGRSCASYLKRVRYGNRDPYLPSLTDKDPWPQPLGVADADASPHWFFEVMLDYDEGHCTSLGKTSDGQDIVSASVSATRTWSVRKDPFSIYRPTFEVRTYRLCRRILMFHHFDSEDIGPGCLVKSTDLTYDFEKHPATAASSIFSFLVASEHASYRRLAAGVYLRRSTPPVELEYSRPVIDPTIHEIDPESLENLPEGLDGARYQWVDLDGEGLSGILTAQAAAWFYKPNLSPISAAPPDFRAGVRARFGPAELVRRQPAPVLEGAAGQQLADLSAEGRLDLVDFAGPVSGYYRRTPREGWETLRAFRRLPAIDWSSPDLRFIDITGDGLADLLISEDHAFVWHRSLGEEGFAPAQRVPQPFDEEQGPVVVFADGTESIFVADMSGDGPTIARVRNGEVCYWPNLGYGRFGPKVTMDAAPWFEAPDLFDARRLRPADIDGSRTTDLIYLGTDGIQIYFNQSGNGWSARSTVAEFPIATELESVAAIDLLGTGTACLAWSTRRPGEARRSMRYIDLMGGQKPHLLVKTCNNLGAETALEYAPSTRFYLADKMAGRPWVTRLPFVVHCLSRVSVRDKWRNTTFSSTYSYHHGYFDGAEREFRGFGRVEQIDVEDYGVFAAANKGSPFVTDQQELFQPPVKTVTWFHTGVFLDERRVLSHYAHEYFPNWLDPGALDSSDPFKENPLPEPEFAQTDLSPEEWREALRACKGMMLRQEIYELDVQALAKGTERPVKLFSAAYHNCRIDRLQRRSRNRHAVFLATESEAITYHYELDLRGPKLAPDPRVAHTLNLRVDDFGRVLQSVSIGYPRLSGIPDSSLPAAASSVIAGVQKEPHLSYTEVLFTQGDTVEDEDNYRLSQSWQTKTFELTGIDASSYLSMHDFRRLQLSDIYPLQVPASEIIDVQPIAYQRVPGGTRQLRLVEHARTLFFDEALSQPLPPGKLGGLGLPYEHYKLALTDDLLKAVFAGKLADATPHGASALETVKDAKVSGYLYGTPLSALFPGLAVDGEYWLRSGVAGYAADARAHFCLPTQYTDPFAAVTTVTYKHDLLLQSSTDFLGNKTSVEAFDFRVLAPSRLRDISGNLTEVKFDILGMPAATALLAKGDGSEGDSLAGLTQDLLDLPLAARQAFFTSTFDQTIPPKWLNGATTRHVYWFGETADTSGKIAWAQHPAASCGFAREQHLAATRAAGAGDSSVQTAIEYTDGLGAVLVRKLQAEPDPQSTSKAAPLRWIASGKTILNNKGKPVKQYEPYFSGTGHGFDLAEAQSDTGFTPILYYDGPGRLVRTERPDGTFSRVDFSPWHVTTYDANDTVLESQWYKDRGPPDPSAAAPAGPDARAAWLTAVHSDTPARTHLDSIGRDVVAIAHNRVEDSSGPMTFAGRHWRDEKYLTFTKLDAEGKALWLRDALGHLVMQYIIPAKTHADPSDTVPTNSVPGYDIAGNLLFQHSMDAGVRWMLPDAAGNPLLAWDRNERQVDASAPTVEDRLYFTEYDSLRRPTAHWITVNGGAPQTIERFEYQDALADDADNLNGQLVRHYDASGLAETVTRDFKGNLATVRKTLVADKTSSVTDWQSLTDAKGSSKLNAEPFTRLTEYDALNRMTRLYNWHRGDGSRVAVYEPHYSERGLLDGERLTVRATKAASGVVAGSGTATQAIVDIAYNVKGQRERLTLGNNTVTAYDYDLKTFRLLNIKTTRTVPTGDACSSAFNDATVIQDLRYTYDPVGNITQLVDAAQATAFASGQRIDANNLYEYDALYRLTSATGRESGATTGAPTRIEGQAPSFACPAPDPTRLRNYAQTYGYDPVGNIQRMRHVGGSIGSWTRDYAYAFDGPGQPASNRLWQTWLGGDRTSADTYTHDTHGNIVSLGTSDPSFHLRWDRNDMIAGLDLGGGGIASYQYDASKRRTRKCIVNQNGGGGAWERIDLAGYELYRRTNGRSGVLEEIDTHHLFESDHRVLLVDDVITASDPAYPRADGLTVKGQTLFRYQYGNHLGSVCLELDAAAQIISYEEFHPYGTSACRAMKSGIEAPPNRYRYTGMERDEESGLSYHGARYYLPWLARWCTCDPLGLRDGPNRFAYTNANPCSRRDRQGTIGEAAQMSLIEQSALRQAVTATDAGRGYGQWLRQTYQSLGSQWMSGPIDVGDPENMPFAITPPGTTRDLFAQLRSENQLVGSTILKPLVQGARKAGEVVRQNERWPGSPGGTFYGQPPQNPNLEGLAGNARMHKPLNLQNPSLPSASEPNPNPSSMPAQMEFDFSAEPPKASQAPGPAPAAPSASSGTVTPSTTSAELPPSQPAKSPIVSAPSVSPASGPIPATGMAKAAEVAADVRSSVASLAEKGKALLYQAPEFLEKANKIAGYALAIRGGWNAMNLADAGHANVPSELSITEFALLTLTGMVDMAGATGKTSWGDWGYMNELMESHADYGMSPKQREIAKWLQTP